MRGSADDLARAVQIALIGEVPPSLRFIDAKLESGVLSFRAVFDKSATEDHLECARVVCTEVLAKCPDGTKLEETIEVDNTTPWPRSESLQYLRYGELSDT